MILLIDCVDVLQSTRSRHSLVTPGDVRAAVLRHLEAKLQAHGDEWFQYKDHVALHLWEQYAQAGRLSPCFVQERYHKEAKASASLRRNTTGYERGLVEELTVSQMISNERASFCKEGLVNPTPADAAVLKAIVSFGLAARGDGVSVSRTYETTSMCKISVHDVAVWRPLGSSLQVGVVLFHFSVSGRCTTVARPCAMRGREGTLQHTVLQADPVAVDSSDLVRAAVFSRTDNAIDVVLRHDEL